jgi:hypothetical protein
MDELVMILENIRRLMEKLDGDDIENFDERLEAAKLELDGWLIEDYRLYEGS